MYVLRLFFFYHGLNGLDESERIYVLWEKE